MAIDDRGHDVQRLFERVCRALGEHRQGAHFPKIATDLIRPTHDGYDLLGLADDGARVVYYDRRASEVLLIPFDKHGLERGGGEVVAHGVDDPRTWLTTHRSRLVWSIYL
jgi:hypothetical protein